MTAFGLFLAIGASPARADGEPPCPDTKATNLVLQVPSQVAVGRPAVIALHLTGADNRYYYTLSDHVSVAAADPAHPIAHPVEDDPVSLGLDDAVANVTFSPGDGAAVVNARWVERIDDGPSKYQYHYCSRSAAAAVITPVAGRLPRVKLSRDRDSGLTVSPSDPLTKQGCALAATEPLTVEARSGCQRATFAMTDPCEFLSDDNGHPGAFLHHTGPINGPRFHMTAASSEGISVDGRGSEDAVRTVTYRVLLGSTVVTKGHFWIRVDRYPGYDIYEGADEFVNTCIDDTYKLHSRDHRLYCYVPGGVIRDYYFTKRPKMPN